MNKAYIRPIMRTTAMQAGQILATSDPSLLDPSNTTSQNGINSADAKAMAGNYEW